MQTSIEGMQKTLKNIRHQIDQAVEASGTNDMAKGDQGQHLGDQDTAIPPPPPVEDGDMEPGISTCLKRSSSAVCSSTQKVRKKAYARVVHED